MKSLTLTEAHQLWQQTLTRVCRKIEYITPDEAHGRVLAEDITAIHPYPPFRKSPFDGYAIHSQEGMRDFTVIATIGAGEVYNDPVAIGEAVRLMTGCTVPPDCDTIIMQEQAELKGCLLHIAHPFAKGDNLISIGEECPAGKMILSKGSRLDGSSISTAVALGNTSLPVYKEPHVLLMTSGRELVMPNQQKKEGQLFNSNFFLLQGILHREGLKDLTFYHVSDDPARFDDELTKVRRLAFDSDLIISTGGVSVGLYDTMPKLYEKLGATPLYRRIVMRPGSASYGAVISHDNSHLTTILGLSGNPAAAFNACHLIAIPILRYLRGDTTTKYPVITCRLTCPINKESVVDRYVQGHIDFIDGQPAFTPNKLLKSSAVLELSHTNGLGLIKKGAPPPQTGQDISVSLLHTI